MSANVHKCIHDFTYWTITTLMRALHFQYLYIYTHTEITQFITMTLNTDKHTILKQMIVISHEHTRQTWNDLKKKEGEEEEKTMK